VKKALAFPLLAMVLSSVLLTGCHTGVTYYPEPSATSPLPTNQPKTSNVVNSTFTVSAGAYTDFPFTIDILMKTPRASGSFQAKTGAIEAFILDDAGFIAFSAHTQVPVLSQYYYSGTVASANIDVAVDGFNGRYHLVFSNPGAQPVSVTANISLNWFAISSIGQR